jgi:hypothetical protein
MAVTDYKYAGTAANVDYNSGEAWTNPDYAKADDTSYAANADNNKNATDWLRLTNFGFTSSDVPSGATIDGIEVVISRYANYENERADSALYLILSGATQGSNYASATKWPTSIANATYGGATDKWGFTPTQANIVDSTFGIQLAVSSTTAICMPFVDYIKIRVYYTEGGATGSQPLKNVFGRPFRGVFR